MTRRILKIILAILGALLVLIVVGGILLYTLFVRTLDLKDYASFAGLPLYDWARVDLSSKTKCSDGSDYRIYTRRGESDNLLVHFAGGGACWDAETCSKPITITDLNGYYFPFIWDIFHASLNGIFDHENPDNPFRDWNVVYIPYCTADFDIGTATNTYPLANGTSVTIYHNGRQNVTEALDWVFATFDHPAKLMISGESAGGFASVLWTPYIAERYPDSAIYQLADGVYLKAAQWPEIVDQVWKADSATNLGFDVGDDLADNAYLHYRQTSAPNVTYLHINTLYDGTLTYFNAKLNGVADDASYIDHWSQELRASMKQVADSGLNYHYFVTDYGRDPKAGTTPHTSVSAPLFYQIEQDGVSLHDWLKRIVVDGDQTSVGSQFLQ